MVTIDEDLWRRMIEMQVIQQPIPRPQPYTYVSRPTSGRYDPAAQTYGGVPFHELMERFSPHELHDMMTRGIHPGEYMASEDKTRAAIERELVAFGASSFGYMAEEGMAVVAFQYKDRRVRFHVPLPLRDDMQFTHTENRQRLRTEAAALDLWDKACREVWRSMHTLIKAKLQATKCGLTTFDHEFLAFMVTPGGETVHDHLREQLDEGLSKPGALMLGWDK